MNYFKHQYIFHLQMIASRIDMNLLKNISYLSKLTYKHLKFSYNSF
jgi:hypothetical protein